VHLILGSVPGAILCITRHIALPSFAVTAAPRAFAADDTPEHGTINEVFENDVFYLTFTHVFRSREYTTQAHSDQFGAINLSCRY
jgi:hypothetical protein